MIELYTYATPNGKKPLIMLEEVGLPYTLKKVDISKKEQFSPEFVKINPNSKIPAIVDTDAGISVFESGAILIYLAEKTGKLLPTDTPARIKVIEWLMFQMANVGPMFGQLGHFRRAAPEKIPYGINRYEKESYRILGVLDKHFAENEFLAGDYSIADIATYPWVLGYEYMEISLDSYPNVLKWIDTLKQRPPVQKGMALFSES